MEKQTIALQHNRPLRIAGPTRIECRAGRLWLTQTGGAGDVFLRAGDSYRLDWPEMVLVEGLGPAGIVLHAPPSRLRHLRRAGRFLLSCLHELMRALRRSRWQRPVAG
jgi:hypothetical protein